MVYCDTTRSGMWRGRKFHENGGVSVWSEGHVLDDIFRDEMLVRFRECIGGVGIVYDNTLMQWYIVIQRVTECGEVKSFTRMVMVKCVMVMGVLWVVYLVMRYL